MTNWPENERPRERLKRYGADGLSEAQLLSIIIGPVRGGKLTSMDLATALLKRFDNLQGIEAASVAELCEQEGVGEGRALQIKSALELGRRVASENHSLYGKPFSSSEEVSAYFIPLMGKMKKEVFKAVLLDSQNRMMKDVTISEGSLNASIVHPREVFKPAIRESAAAVILVHNHPSGDPTPSRNDIDITEKLVDSGRLIGIEVLDHIIIGSGKHYSFCDEGRL